MAACGVIDDDFKIAERIQRKRESKRASQGQRYSMLSVSVAREKREKDAVTFLELYQTLSSQVKGDASLSVHVALFGCRVY